MKTWSTHRREVKAYARKHLAGNFLKGVFAALISFTLSFLALSFMPLKMPTELSWDISVRELVMSMLPDTDIKITLALTGICLLLNLLLTAPLSIGTHRFYLTAMRGEKAKFWSIFSPFLCLGEVFSACSLFFLSALFRILIAVALFIVPVGLLVFSPVLGPMAQIAGLVLYLPAGFLLLVLCMPFVLAPFVLAEKPERGAFRSILIAFKRLRGVKCELLVFDLSFILWRLIFGLNAPGMFFIEPYITASMARFYDTVDTRKK